jgi:Mg-chelatase subunit ChlD
MLAAVLVGLGACSSRVDTAPLGSSGGAGGGGGGGTAGVPAGTGGEPVTIRLDADSATATNTSTSTGPTADANCGGQVTDLKRRPANVLLVLDRSASMSDTDKGNIWTFVVPAIEGIIQRTQHELQWGLMMFPYGDGSECTAGTLPAASQVNPPVGLDNYAAIVAQIPSTATGNGTPTDSAIVAGMNYLQAVTNDYPRYMVLATDGVPSCVGAAGSSTSNGVKTGVTAAVSAIAAAYAAGIPTFVVGINSPSSSSSLGDLTAMADAGGEALPHATCPPGASASACTGAAYTGFYLATDESALADALGKIIGAVSSCQIQLDTAPPVPAFVAVKVTYAAGHSTQVFQKGSGSESATVGSWSYVDGQSRVLELDGPACDTIAAGAGGTFEIWFGCTAVPIF